MSEEESLEASSSSTQGISKNFKTAPVAIFFAIHLPFLKQMSGINAISVYGKEALIPVISEDLSNIIPIFNSLMPGLTAILTAALMNRLGRKFFIQFGTVTACFCELIIFIGFFIDGQHKVASPILISVGMIVFMANMAY